MSITSVWSLPIGILGFIAIWSPMACAQDTPPLVVNEPIPVPESDSSNRPIIGFRAASASFVDNKLVKRPGEWKSTDLFLPEEVVIKAWLKDENFSEAVKARNISTDSIASILAGGIDLQGFEWEPIGEGYRSIKPIVVAEQDPDVTSQIDSTVIVGMTANRVLNLNQRYEIVAGANRGYALAIDPKYSEELLYAYQASDFYGKSQLSDSSIVWKSPKDLLTMASQRYPIGLEKSLLVQIGSVSFGKIRARSAKEAQLKIDVSTARDYDVYLVDLVTTLHNIDKSKVSQVSFRAQCMIKDCIAWELAPLRVGTEISVQETAKSPEISIDGIKVGEFYGRTISYKSLRPTITAFGLREDEFSWLLQDEAIGMGSFAFMAAIGVPKGTRELRFQESVGLKTKKFYWLEGDWAVSNVNEGTVQLRP